MQAIYRMFRSQTEEGAALRGFVRDIITFGAFVGAAAWAAPVIASNLRVDTNPNSDDYFIHSSFKDESDYYAYRMIYNS